MSTRRERSEQSFAETECGPGAPASERPAGADPAYDRAIDTATTRGRAGGSSLRSRLPMRRRRARETAPHSPDGMRPWQLIRHAPAPVWAVTALFAVILACWSVLTPIYHAADEPNHADAVMRVEEGRGWQPAKNTRVTDEGIGATAASPYGVPPRRLALNLRSVPAALAPPRDDRPEWQNLKPAPGTSGRLIQQMTEHPPGYYLYEGLILRLGGAAGWRWDIAVSTMRLLSAFLIMWIPLLAWAIAWRLTGSRRAGICAAVFPLAIPELSHVGASVNNDNLVTLAGAAALVGLACALRGDRSKSTAVWTGLWMTVALWAKAFGLVLLPLAIIVYALPWLRDSRSEWRRRRQRRGASAQEGEPSAPTDGATPPARSGWRPDRTTVVTGLLSTGLAVALGCWWYVISEVRYGTLTPKTPSFPAGRYLGDDWALFLRYPTEAITRRWWGDLGWFEIQLPWRLVVTVSVLGALIAAYGVYRWRGRRLALVLMLWPTFVTYVVVSGQVTRYFMSTHYLRGISGRYLFIGIAGVAALVGIGLAVLPSKLARWAPLALLVGAIGMQVEAAHLAVNHWWRPLGGTLRQAWNAFSSWSTWPVGVLWTGIALVVVLAVVSLALLIRVGVRGDAIEMRPDALAAAGEQPTSAGAPLTQPPASSDDVSSSPELSRSSRPS